MLPGIDVSNHQTDIDWPKVATSPVAFVWAKASEGRGFTDRYYDRNVKGALDAGIGRVGGYHFARPGRSSPAQEMGWFLSKLTGDETIGPVIDWEHAETVALSPRDATAWLLEALRILAGEQPLTPWVYTGGTPGAHLADDPALAEFPLWFPWYLTATNHQANMNKVASGFRPRPPSPWPAWQVWQYSSSGSIPGVAGRCDTNVAVIDPATIDTPRPDLGGSTMRIEGWIDADAVRSPKPGVIEVAGWAVDLASPERAVDVNVYVADGNGDRVVPTVTMTANAHRPDIASKGYGTRHGFGGRIEVPRGGRMRVDFDVEGKVGIPNSPRHVAVSDPPPPEPKPTPGHVEVPVAELDQLVRLGDQVAAKARQLGGNG